MNFLKNDFTNDPKHNCAPFSFTLSLNHGKNHSNEFFSFLFSFFSHYNRSKVHKKPNSMKVITFKPAVWHTFNRAFLQGRHVGRGCLASFKSSFLNKC